MKPQSQNHPVNTVQNSITQGIPKRKILLYTTDYQSGLLVLRHLKEAGQSVVETVDEAEHLNFEIARTNPHLLIAHAPVESAVGEMVLKQLQLSFPDLSVCLISGDLSQDHWQQGLREVLARPAKPETPRPYAESSRLVYLDETLSAYTMERASQPDHDEDLDNLRSQQESRFIMQLQTARKNHPAARHYFDCLSQQQAGLDKELVHLTVHGSHEALSRSRDLAIKWLALIAHYVPDVELEYLPKAGTPGPVVEFVHHTIPLEGVYVVTLTIFQQVKPTMGKAIQQLALSRFDGQNEDDLLTQNLQIYGLAKLLQQIGTAQIALMDAWLDPTTVNRTGGHDFPLGGSRNLDTYRDFYEFGDILGEQDSLVSILKDFHSGLSHLQQERFFPSFAEWRRSFRTSLV